MVVNEILFILLVLPVKGCYFQVDKECKGTLLFSSIQIFSHVVGQVNFGFKIFLKNIKLFLKYGVIKRQKTYTNKSYETIDQVEGNKKSY